MSGNISPTTSTIELYGSKLKIYNSLLPTNLEPLLQRLDYKDYNEEYFIFNHSVLRIYRLILSKEKLGKAISAIKRAAPLTAYTNSGIVLRFNWPKNLSHVCLECIKSDKEKYGEAYYKNLHQVSGYVVCHIHNKPLQRVVGDFKKRNYFIDINDHKTKLEEFDITETLKGELTWISHEIFELYKLDVDSIEHEGLVKKYRYSLKKKGYLKGSRVSVTKLSSDFHERYSEQLLNYFDLNSINQTKKWLTNIVKVNDYSERLLKHVLLILFIFGSVKEMVDFDSSIFDDSFGEGPWPCLNSISTHYGEKTIMHYQISKSNRKMNRDYFMGIFKCEQCGYSYMRKDTQPEMEKYSPVEYGHVWDGALKRLIIDEGLDYREVAKEFSVQPDRILTSIKRLDLVKYCITDIPPSKKEYMMSKTENKSEIRKEIRDKHRVIIHNFVFQNPNVNRKTIIDSNSHSMAWLRKNDSKWLESVLPPKRENIEILKKYSHTGNIDWPQKDLTIRKQLIDFMNSDEYQNVLNRSRITRTYLDKTIGYFTLKHREKIPISWKLGENIIETHEEYYNKKLDQLLSSSENITMTKTEIISKIGCGGAPCIDSIKARIDKMITIVS